MKHALFTLAALAAASASAQAGMVEMRWVGIGLGTGVRTSLSGNVQEVYAGQIAHEFRNGTGAGALFNGQTIMTYCTELTQHVSADWHLYDVTGIASAPVPGPAMGLQKASAIHNMLSLLVAETNAGRFGVDMAAGFQLAVWEVVYDFDSGVGRGSLDVAAGDFLASDTGGGALAVGIAAHVTAFLDHASVAGVDILPFAFVNEGRQDQIIPTPGSVALACVGGLLMARRRREA